MSTESLEKAFQNIDNNTYKGKWLCVFFYPKDFTFVCPTEIKGFGDLNQQFADRDCQVLAASTDSEFVHLAWRKDHKDLHDLKFPMLADINKESDRCAGHPRRRRRGAARGVPGRSGRHHPLRLRHRRFSVGRNPAEVLRVLDALQTDELCPCNWNQGDETLKVA